MPPPAPVTPTTVENVPPDVVLPPAQAPAPPPRSLPSTPDAAERWLADEQAQAEAGARTGAHAACPELVAEHAGRGGALAGR